MRHTSTSSVEDLPPDAESIERVRSPALFLATLLRADFIMNFMPCFSRIFLNSLAMSPSAPAQIASWNSTTVTSAPRRRQTEPISSPMTPPPMTAMRLGTSWRSRAPVEETTCCSSISMPGRLMTSLPVAMMMFLVLMTCSLPLASTTFTSLGPTMVPVPSAWLTLFFLKRPLMPPVRPVTAVLFCFSICGRLRFTCGTSTP
mmetsp:Transcript_19775/g.75826  ORF Transcript_19775/g.75826 Transcript_19775/m.75826 type:complete len:202 (+) Transcript_19775:654-1259(+)